MNQPTADRVSQAIQFAFLHALLIGDSNVGGVRVAPFTLEPTPLEGPAAARLAAVHLPFLRFAAEHTRSVAFLRHTLGPLTASDPFMELLLRLLPDRPAQPLELLVARNDFLIGKNNQPQQVELNLIAAAGAHLADATCKVHRALSLADGGTARSIVSATDSIAAAIARAVEAVDIAGGKVLMVVHDDEPNSIDQRALELSLLIRHGLPMLRSTLHEVAECGRLKEGHLWLHNQQIPLVYFRTTYSPDQLQGEARRRARALIEASSAIKVPTIATQLAGTKLVQRSYERLVAAAAGSDPDCRPIGDTLCEMWSLDEPGVAELALSSPEAFVLKPQREGGGNCYFGSALHDKVSALDPQERKTFVLMRRIDAAEYDLTIIRDGAATRGKTHSEIGLFGCALCEGERVREVWDCGSLVRSKPVSVDQAGVVAGYGALSSIYPTA